MYLRKAFPTYPRLNKRGPPTKSPKGPKYLHGTKYGFCSGNFPYGLGKYSPYGYLGPFGKALQRPLSFQKEVSWGSR